MTFIFLIVTPACHRTARCYLSRCIGYTYLINFAIFVFFCMFYPLCQSNSLMFTFHRLRRIVCLNFDKPREY